MRRMNLKKANVARSNTIRHINRQIVLNYVREKEPISRAEISHETALQRSTVSLIVEELKTKGLIDEIEGESTGGRPPLLLRLRAGGPVAIGVDLGTAETSVATGDLAGRILKRETFVTDPNLETTFKQIEACVKRFLSTEPGIEGIGISLPGMVDPETGEVDICSALQVAELARCARFTCCHRYLCTGGQRCERGGTGGVVARAA